jgi:hypothetical protein
MSEDAGLSEHRGWMTGRQTPAIRADAGQA